MSASMNPVTWFEIYVDDLARAKVFYESVFKYSLIPETTDGSFEAFRFPGAMPGNGVMGGFDETLDAKTIARRKHGLLSLRKLCHSDRLGHEKWWKGVQAKVQHWG